MFELPSPSKTSDKIIDVQNVYATKMITLSQIADDIITYQSRYTTNLNKDLVMNELYKVLANPEVYDTIMTGALIDTVASTPDLADRLPVHFKTLIHKLQVDYPGYGIDEQLGISIAKQYGSISEASFGDLDNNKFGVAKNLDTAKGNTILDDITLGIISAVSGKIARKYDTDVITSKQVTSDYALIVNHKIVAKGDNAEDIASLNRSNYHNLGIVRKF